MSPLGDEVGITQFDFRVGTGSNPNEDVIRVDIFGTSATILGLTQTNIASINGAAVALAVADASLNYLISARATLGAVENRITNARSTLAVTIENSESAKAAYLEADIAQEITSYTALQIMNQAGISTLAQANQIPRNLLELFQTR